MLDELAGAQWFSKIDTIKLELDQVTSGK